MINQIEQRIKEKYKTKGKFCEEIGIDWKDYVKKIKVLKNKIDWLNKFLKPLDLEINIKKASE